MFAIIRTGGKQYRVAKNDIIKVEKLDGEAGAKVVFDEVLMMGDDSGIKVGTPYLADTRVDAEILTQDRDNKIIVFKKKRRKNYRRKQGHRQDITVLRITGVEAAKPRRKAQGAAAKTKADDQPKGGDKPADTAAEKVKAEESN